MDENRSELMRQLIEMAIACGRKRKSAQTGYLHHCHGLNEQEPHLPIPLVENFLYALALLRSRMVENINEAKIVLEGLLHFQNTQDGEIAHGNFPIYVHDYPVCKDRFTALHVAAAICWILKLFHQILGQELKARLEKSLSLAVRHVLKVHSEKAAPFPAAIKVAAVAINAGKLLADNGLETQGNALLEDLHSQSEEMGWYCPEAIGEIMVALAMVYPRLGDSPWSAFWEYVQKTWHHKTGSYIGPALKEWQLGDEPQTTAYDLFLGYLSGNLSMRAKKDNLVHLEVALIPPLEDLLPLPHYPQLYEGTINGAKWSVFQEQNYAYSCVDQGAIAINPVFAKGFHPLKLVWGDLQRVHTFVCQDGNTKSATFTPSGANIDIDCILGNLIEFEDREQSREVAFFFDACEGIEFQVAGHKSSTFQPDELLSLRSAGLSMQLTFYLKEGDGRFLGHRMMGNRPAQIGAKGPTRYNAYDWQLFLRTVRRSEECRVGVRLKIEEV